MVDSKQRYKEYPEYKDSGVEWLGEIPSHWQVKRLGQFFKERREKVSDKDYPPLSVTMKGIVPQLENAAKSDAGDNRKLVLKNDFVINSRSDRKGSSGISSLDGSVSLISIVLEPKGISPRYAHHLLRSYNFQEEFYRHGKGIVADLWSTNSSEMKDILIPEISENESNAIASFLDHETAKIDILIEKQQRLIELLTEKRQAVISHAVTKGLNPDVPMKDSGVEWLGEVPEHWEVTKVGYHALKIGSGKTPRGGSEVYLDEGVLFLRSQNVYDDGLRIGESESVFISETTHDEMSNSKVFDGDILLNITGGSIGRSCLVPYGFAEANVNQHVCIIRVPEYLQEYLAYVMKSLSIKVQIDSIQSGSNREGVNFEQIANFVFCLPDISEIKEIISYIKSEEIRFISLINKAHQAIQLMQERRTALISAAVTGKIDVRDWVRPE